MEPLKEMFNATYYRQLAAAFDKVYKGFRSKAFLKEVTDNLESRELNERLRNTSVILKNYLPDDFEKATGILKEVAPLMKAGYTALVFPDYIAQYCRKNFKTSIEALKYFTVFGSSEFAIREFLRLDLMSTLKIMEKWAHDVNHHVRRLASEGSRPRLPWSFRLDEIVRNPSLTKNILSTLRSDDHLYVRKSVANHLNDISKDHPDYMLQLVGKWDLENPHTRWIVKHACRTLIKKGHRATLQLFSVRHDVKASVTGVKLSSASISLGEVLEFSCQVTNKESSAQRFVIDYAITYARPGKTSSRKVFKLKELTFAPGASAVVSRRQLFRDFSTRTHYPGKHQLEILLNGTSAGSKTFTLTKK